MFALKCDVSLVKHNSSLYNFVFSPTLFYRDLFSIRSGAHCISVNVFP